MTSRPVSITLILQERLGELQDALKPSRDYSAGACRGSNTELFFSDITHEVNQALKICSSCPIRLVCLEDALATNEYGIWGGTTESMREQISADRDLREKERISVLLPDSEEVAYELEGILCLPVSKVCHQYKVKPRTVYRWRDDIRGNQEAMQLVQKVSKHG